MTWQGVPWTTLAAIANLLLAAIALPFLKVRIERVAARKVDKQLKDHQHLLDVQLEVQRTNLAVDVERARADLQKHTTDDAIYVARRHEYLVTYFSDILGAYAKASEPPYAALGAGYKAAAARATATSDAHDLAEQAYNRATLYLPDAVETVAERLNEAFLRNWIAWLDLSGTSLPPSSEDVIESRHAAQKRLDDCVKELREVSRRELQGARPLPVPPRPHA